MKPVLSPNDRMMKVLQAPPDVQARIDAVLDNRNEPTRVTTGPLLFNMGQAAKYLGVSRSTLWRVIQAGRITPVEIRAKSFKIRRADLEQLAGLG